MPPDIFFLKVSVNVGGVSYVVGNITVQTAWLASFCVGALQSGIRKRSTARYRKMQGIAYGVFLAGYRLLDVQKGEEK